MGFRDSLATVKSWSIFNQQAFTALELLLALAITSIIIAFLIPAVRMLTSLKIQLEQNLRAKQLVTSATHLLSEGISQSDQIFSLPLIDISPLGESHGTLQISEASSNAISFIIVDPLQMLFTLNSEERSLSFCKRENLDYLPSKESLPLNWIGIGLDGVSSFQGRLVKSQKKARNEKCPSSERYSGSLVNTKNPLLTNNSLKLSLGETIKADKIKVLLGIKDSYTIYLDQKKTLRRFSHLNNEHQPLLIGIQTMSIKQLRIANSASLIEIELTLDKKKYPRLPTFRSFYSRGSIEPQHYIDLLS